MPRKSPKQATPKPAAADAPTTSSQTASAIVSSDIANGSKGAPVESTSSAPKKRAAKRKADAEMPVEDKNAMEVDDGAAATAASSTDDSLKKQKISDASRASAAATTVGHEQVDVTMMDESVDGECLALVAEQLCLNKPFEWTLTHHVEAYDGKETNAVHNNLRQHLAALLKTNTPLQAAQQQLILDMIGVSDSSYQVLPSALQQQTLQHVHTIRAPSAGKALVHRMPSTKWPPHPLVLEFGTGDKANAHIIQHGKMTIGGAWMCLWNELLPAENNPSSSLSKPSHHIPTSSSLTYSFRAHTALSHRFKYFQSNSHGLSLVGDRVSVSIVFVEWAPQRDSKVDEREVPWTCWKMREVADPQVRFENSRYKAEQPEKD